MAFGKWIGGFLGFISGGGPLAVLAGMALGALFDKGLDSLGGNDEPRRSSGPDPGYGYSGRGTGGAAYQSGFGRAQQYARQRPCRASGEDFLFSLLALASYVIRADGRVMHSEMEYVRHFLRVNFGEEAVTQGNDILLRLFDEQKRMNASAPYAFRDLIRQSAMQIAANMSYEQRLQLVAFLVKIARADGNVADAEVQAIREVAQYMRIVSQDVESLLSLGGDSLDDAYRVLGVTPDATDDEVRRAYRQLALKHHPDRVATLGEDIRRAAEQKLQMINEAKERVYKSRGM